MSTKILFLGATGEQFRRRSQTLAERFTSGYLGGSTLVRLLEHSKRSTFEITVYIRAASKAEAFQSLGLKTIIGSLDDHDLLEGAAFEADIIFQSVSKRDLSPLEV
jgi:hypothetical protein